MEAFLIALPVMGIHLAAVMSPGPNFIIVSQNALIGSRRDGLKTAAGLGLGALIWVVSGFLGVTWLMTRMPGIVIVLKWIGGGYLAYLGVRILMKLWSFRRREQNISTTTSETESDSKDGFWTGLVTTLTNPKAAFYVLAVFTSMVGSETPEMTRLILGIMLPIISFSWYSVVALLFSMKSLQAMYLRLESAINLVFGLLLIYFSGSILMGSMREWIQG